MTCTSDDPSSKVPFIIVLLSGWAGSGKDTTADYLCDNFGFKRFAFADALKTTVSKQFNVPVDMMNTHKGKQSTLDQYGGITVRQLLIREGELARSKDIDVWAKVIIQEIKDSMVEGRSKRFVISDWRLETEYKAMLTAFDKDALITMRIVRWEKPPIDDKTETNLDTFTFDETLDNTHGKDILRKQVDEWAKRTTLP